LIFVKFGLPFSNKHAYTILKQDQADIYKSGPSFFTPFKNKISLIFIKFGRPFSDKHAYSILKQD
jgi:hypothetical protein